MASYRSVLSQKLLQSIRTAAPVAEQEKQLTPELLAIIYEQQWFRLLTPKAYGGLELPLPEVVQMEEALAHADGSLGWVVTLCAGAGWFGGFINNTVATHIFADPNVCLAGSGAPTGTAALQANGYLVNGRWAYASGAPDATVFTANCYITQNGTQLKDDAGNPRIVSFAFYRKDVTIIPTWQSMGMVATASQSYSVTDLFVPQEQTFIIDTQTALVDAPLYRYPFLQLAEVTLTANLSGMALHFMELCTAILKVKKTRSGHTLSSIPAIEQLLSRSSDELQLARAQLYNTLNDSWKRCEKDKPIDKDLLRDVSRSAYALVNACRRAVDGLYPYCGLAAADTTTDINRVWRDFHTASQHSLLALGGLSL